MGARDSQRAVGKAVLEHGLSKVEVRQVAQLIARSGRSAAVCVKEVLGMRPKVEKRYVFVGSVVDDGVLKILGRCSQRERDGVLAAGMKAIGLVGAAGRLGVKMFTLVGDEGFNASMKEVGKEGIEPRLRAYIAETLENGEIVR